MDWLRPAVVFLTFGTTALAVTFFHLGISYRRRYVLLWGWSWLAAVPHLLLVLLALGSPLGSPAWIAAQICMVAGAALTLAGTLDLVHRRVPARALLLATAPFAAWCLVAPRITADFTVLTLPVAIFLAAAQLWTASRFHVLAQRGGPGGARALAVCYGLLGMHQLDYPWLGGTTWAPVGYALAAVLAFASAVALVLLVLEESRAELVRERARLRAILDHLPVGVVVAGPAGTIELANAFARPWLAAHGDAARVADVEPALLRAAGGATDPLPLERALREQVVTAGRELELVAGDAPRAVLVSAVPLGDPGGPPLGAVAVIQDVHEHKRLQRELMHAERLRGLGTLAAGVAHDFNNSLTLILGHADLAIRRGPEPKVVEHLETVRRVGQECVDVVRRIQDLAQSRTPRDGVVFDLDAVAREVVELTRPRWRDEAEARGVRYEVRSELVPARVAGHPSEVRDALFDLVLNALDAMPDGGTLEVALAVDGAEAVLTVHDDGAGMSAEIAERVFDPFYSTQRARGKGLGLSVAFSVVQRHGGRLRVASVPGRGSTFTMRLPLAPELVAAAPRAPRIETARLRVLVVDDQPEILRLIQGYLEPAGHEVVVAASGEEALARCAERIFDVVLTDLGMPGMNGWELAEQLRAAGHACGIVLVTGWGETIADAELARTGVDAVLAKPFGRAGLLDAVRRHARVAPQRAA